MKQTTDQLASWTNLSNTYERLMYNQISNFFESVLSKFQ